MQLGPVNISLEDGFFDDFFGFQGKNFTLGRVKGKIFNAESRKKGKKAAFEVLC